VRLTQRRTWNWQTWCSRSSYSATLLNDLLLKAEANPGTKQTARLPNGLKVDIKVDTDQTFLQISRSSVYPSETEWMTIEQYWPHPLKQDPRKIHYHGRRYLQAIFPHQQRLVILQPE
jgi:hypothetical protein